MGNNGSTSNEPETRAVEAVLILETNSICCRTEAVEAAAVVVLAAVEALVAVAVPQLDALPVVYHHHRCHRYQSSFS